jgi:hypothetical protein
VGYLCARERGLPSNPQLLRVHEKRERAVIPRLYERGRVMTYDQAEEIFNFYQEKMDLIPLITAIRARDYQLEREGK